MSREERALSPTTEWTQRRRQAREKMATMMNMGLHVFHPAWQGSSVTYNVEAERIPHGKQFSTSFREITLKIFGTDEKINFPVQTCTKVADVRDALANFLCINADELVFLERKGYTTRIQLDCEEIGRYVNIKGAKSFKPQTMQWPHPTAVIGAGYHGLKTMMMHAKQGNNDFVCFDRNDKVGGYCWITAANRSSRLQTEFAAFHVWWGPENQHGKCQWPIDWETWPTKPRILAHFQQAAEEYGLLPHINFKSNVATMQIIGDKNSMNHHYLLEAMSVGEDAIMKSQPCSIIYHYPGSMTRNRIVTYPGEADFGGNVWYGMGDEFELEKLKGIGSAILGNGAFAVENARTCCEWAASKIYIVTRRKNLASPRAPCWFCHQGPVPTPGAMLMRMLEPMYKFGKWDEPWAFHSCYANSERTRATVIQSSRFGIGDITFLLTHLGMLEYIEDTLKRCSHQTLHMTGGRKVEDVGNIIKCLGLLGDYAVDRLHKQKQMVGTFCDGDWRRVLMIDATGMNAANFETFSTGIGTTGFVRNHKFMHDHPMEYYKMQGMGLLDSLPRNKVNEDEDKPAYVVDVKFAMSSGIIMGSMLTKSGYLFAGDGDYKFRMYHYVHSTDKFLEDAIASWDQYQKTFKERGLGFDYCPYPYTKEMIKGWFDEYSTLVGVPIDVDGPPDAKKQPEFKSNETKLGVLPDWANDEGNLDNMERGVHGHAEWWMNSPGFPDNARMKNQTPQGPTIVEAQQASSKYFVKEHGGGPI